MGRLSEKFFTQAEKEKVAALIQEAEATTAGEIVVMVVDQSDEYREAAVGGGIIAGAFVALLISVVLKHDTIWFYLPIAFACSFPLYFLFRRLPRLCLPLVPRGRRERVVRERGIRAFFEKGLHRTRDESGILIFLSLLEHKVWILGDRGIDARINPEGWKALADRVARGIAEGHAADALCSVIIECKEILATHFPRRSDDTNELADHVIT